MKDFIILTKNVEMRKRSGNSFSSDYIQIDYLIQETYKESPDERIRFKEFEIDRSSIKFEVIQGVLYVVMIAFKKDNK